ncbi:response regulator [Rhizobium jaguaris]|uniref:response regulator n=1 Tax=Rhizobium jaguaris TaxID=1312183 RepID=UPI0039BF3D64
MLVEDDAILGDALRDHVAADGWDVDWVADLQGAKRAVDAACYSLILLDPGLPDGSGLELLTHLSARSPATPTIIISADDQVTDRQRSLQLGAADCLVKPFSLSTLSARIRNVLSTSSRVSGTSALLDRSGDACDGPVQSTDTDAPQKGKEKAARWLSTRSRRTKIAGALAATLALPILGIGIYLAALQLSGNFHQVIPGELYRSAQLSPAEIETYVHDNGIRTIINLRGENKKRAWYDQEIDTARRLGIEHIDFKMSASKILTPDRADQLVSILRSAPKPILIHCQSGADRTGLVAVIYSQQIAGIDQKTAERQLSIVYGHIGIPYLSSAFAMDESLQNLEKHFSRLD